MIENGVSKELSEVEGRLELLAAVGLKSFSGPRVIRQPFNFFKKGNLLASIQFSEGKGRLSAARFTMQGQADSDVPFKWGERIDGKQVLAAGSLDAISSDSLLLVRDGRVVDDGLKF